LQGDAQSPVALQETLHWPNGSADSFEYAALAPHTAKAASVIFNFRFMIDSVMKK
jgi:hypothetical protein